MPKYSDSGSDDDGAMFGFGSQKQDPLLLTLPKISRSNFADSDTNKNYLTISPPIVEPTDISDIPNKPSPTVSFASLFAAIGTPESIIQKGSEQLLIFLSSTYRLLWVSLVILATLYFYPLISTMFLGGLALLIFGGHGHDDTKPSYRTAKWTVTGFSYQMKDGFLASPSILDKSGQWRLVIKQKKGMDGVQTTFGLLCTDIYPDIEVVTAKVKFECTNPRGQEIQTGGMNNLEFKSNYYCAGDCAFTRPVRLSRKNLGDDDTIMLHCTVEFHKKSINFLKMLAGNIRDANEASSSRYKKGKNVVTEHGTIYAGDLEFQDDDNFPPAFRSMLKFVHHSQSRTFVWEIPGFTTLLENSEIWGIFSPQFFLVAHDICSIWRMKLMEVQGVFRLHVQLRGLPTPVKQVKLWYLLHLVDNLGDSVIPEHAVSRVKYPDHMNLWDTTRHILYRRETILERFVTATGGLTLRITLQMEPNDLSLMEVDSDEWIPSRVGLEQQAQLTSGALGNHSGSIQMQKQPMLTN